jgi:predicted ArsR family transcriptional regulator
MDQNSPSPHLEADSPPARTRERVIAVLREHPRGLTIGELTGLVGLKQNAVRKHLVALAAAGSVTAERLSPSAVGRPPARYRLVEANPNVLADRVLARLLLAASGGVGEGAAEQIALDSSLVRSRTSTLDDTLSVLGFAPADVTPAAKRRVGGRTIELRACPFLELVGQPNGRLICAFHRGLVRRDMPEGSTLEEFRVVPNGPRCRVVLAPAGDGRTEAVA